MSKDSFGEFQTASTVALFRYTLAFSIKKNYGKKAYLLRTFTGIHRQNESMEKLLTKIVMMTMIVHDFHYNVVD